MLTKTTTVSAAFVGAAAFAATALAAETQERQVDPFTGLHLKGSADVTVTVGGDQRVTLSGENLEDVQTRVKNGILRIRQKGGGWLDWSDDDLEVTITVPSLESAQISGAADMTVTGIDSPRFTLDVSGAGEVDLAGSCGEGRIKISGAGEVEAKDLHCETMAIDISGAGEAEVYASRELSLEISGAGEVDLYGGGRIVKQSISGAGEVTVHDGSDG